MVELKIGDNTILVVMDSCKKNVLQYFSKKFLSCPKIFTISEFIDQYYFSYDERAIYYLMRKYHYHYDVSVMYLSLLYAVDDEDYDLEKIKKVQGIKTELKNQGLLSFNSFFREYLKKKSIVFYHVCFDGKTNKLYQDLKKDFQVSIFPFEKEQYDCASLYEFEDISSEVVYVAGAIMEKIKQGVKPSKIKLCGVLGEYLPLVQKVFTWFSIPLNLSDNYLYGTKMGQDFLRHLSSDPVLSMNYLKEHYALQSKEEFEVFSLINDIVNRYVWIDDYLKIKELLIHDFKKAKLKGKIRSCGIQVISHLRDVLEDEYVFLLGFNQGIVPKLYKDEGYFNDFIKEQLGLLSTKDENIKEKDRWIREIRSVKNLVITFKKKSPLGDFYLSSLNDILKYKVEKGKITYRYSKLYNQLVLGEKLDTLVKYNEKEVDLDYLYQGYRDIPYLRYDSSFKGISKEKLKNYLEGRLTLSYSAMNSYYQCGFRYYLSNILKLNLFPNTFYTVLGNIFHEVLSKYRRDDFDFSKVYDQSVEKYGEIYHYDAREKFFLNHLENELKFIIDTIRKQEEFSCLTESFLEEKIVKNYHYPSYDVCFKGFVDKMMVNEKENLVSIIDYKTGNPNLNLNHTIYGLDLQLPIYLFLAKNKFPEARIVGFYLQKILNSEISRDNQHSYLELKEENLKLQGYSNSDIAVLSKFDSTYDASKVIKGMRTTSKGFGTKKILNDLQMEALSNLAEKKVEEAISGIITADFSIHPKRIGKDNLGCKYCCYQDICFMSEKDIVDLEEYKNLEFLEEENIR